MKLAMSLLVQNWWDTADDFVWKDSLQLLLKEAELYNRDTLLVRVLYLKFGSRSVNWNELSLHGNDSSLGQPWKKSFGTVYICCNKR